MHDKCSIYRNHSNIKACAETEQPYITYINHKSRFLNWESSKTYIQIFKNEQFGQVRVITKDSEPWLCLSDICKSLGLGNVTEVKKRLNSKGLSTIETLTNGGKQNLIYVDESNFYKVIFQSRKAEAEKFTEWVTSDVLPSIRKHGMYATDELINNPDLLIAAATKIKEAIR